MPEGELIRRVAALKGERAAEDLASHWEELRGIGMDSAVAEAQERLRARMNDVSEFIKTFKELFNVWFKRERGYSGSIWDGRFKSTLVEDGRYRAICMRYVYLNPVRAGMVKHAADYAWSWIATFDSTFAGSVPDERLMRRVAQIGAGKIFGSLAFPVAERCGKGCGRAWLRDARLAAREGGGKGNVKEGEAMTANIIGAFVGPVPAVTQ